MQFLSLDPLCVHLFITIIVTPSIPDTQPNSSIIVGRSPMKIDVMRTCHTILRFSMAWTGPPLPYCTAEVRDMMPRFIARPTITNKG